MRGFSIRVRRGAVPEGFVIVLCGEDNGFLQMRDERVEAIETFTWAVGLVRGLPATVAT